MSIKVIEGGMTVARARFCLVVARWNSFVVDSLEAGAIDTLKRHGAEEEDITIVRVPGAFEMPVALAKLAASGDYDAIIALGAVIRGGTPHFEYVCQAATDGLNRVALDYRIPVGFGLLTCDDLDQALDRAGLEGSKEDKGAEAMLSAINAAAVLAQIRAESQD